MKVLLVIPALFALALGYVALDEGSGLGTWLGGRAELAAAVERVERLEAEIAHLEREAVLLENDPFSIERAIREELRFARPDETVVRHDRRRLAGGTRSNPRIP